MSHKHFRRRKNLSIFHVIPIRPCFPAPTPDHPPLQQPYNGGPPYRLRPSVANGSRRLAHFSHESSLDRRRLLARSPRRQSEGGPKIAVVVFCSLKSAHVKTPFCRRMSFCLPQGWLGDGGDGPVSKVRDSFPREFSCSLSNALLRAHVRSSSSLHLLLRKICSVLAFVQSLPPSSCRLSFSVLHLHRSVGEGNDDFRCAVSAKPGATWLAWRFIHCPLLSLPLRPSDLACKIR